MYTEEVIIAIVHIHFTKATMSIFQKFGQFILRLIKFFFYGSAAVAGMMFTITFGIIVLVAISAAASATSSSKSEDKAFAEEKTVYGKEDAKKTFLAVDINGVIMGDQLDAGGWSALLTDGVTFGYKVKEQLMEAAKNKDIDGVILVINSPGGTIFGSEAIADGVKYYKQNTDKPVITYVSGMAASGGYWSAVAGDVIVADHGTAIGSIGVIYGPFKYYDRVVSEDGGAFVGGVVTQGGVQTTYITAGRSKDIGNPYRQLTKEEIDKLQANVNDSYNEFVTHVSNHRGIAEEVIKNNLGAMIYGEKQALENKMIDMIGSKEEAYRILADRAGVRDENFRVIRQGSAADFWETVFGAISRQQTPTAAAVATQKVQICGLSANVLAYHGDVATLCE